MNEPKAGKEAVWEPLGHTFHLAGYAAVERRAAGAFCIGFPLLTAVVQREEVGYVTCAIPGPLVIPRLPISSHRHEFGALLLGTLRAHR